MNEYVERQMKIRQDMRKMCLLEGLVDYYEEISRGKRSTWPSRQSRCIRDLGESVCLLFSVS